MILLGNVKIVSMISYIVAYYSGRYGGYRGGYIGFDWTYILVLIGFVFSMITSGMVNSTYAKYNKVFSANGVTGSRVAEEILRYQGIHDVKIQHISGNLTDNFNPTTKVVSLSDATFDSSSVAAAGVAAHECGHVIQHHIGYAPIKIRNAIVPVASLGTKVSYIFILLGLLFGSGISQVLLNIGIYAFIAVVAFQVITLPVELDASHRALKILKQNRLLNDKEIKMARKVLTAAAMTYVAAVATALLQLLRLVILFGGNRRRN